MKELPEDSNLWPSDPFTLLNLKRSDDTRTAKRAYFKLIRKYKPDRFPAEFQKIREAYESVESWMSWQERDVESTNAEDPIEATSSSTNSGVSSSVDTTGETDATTEDSETVDTFEPTPVLADPIDLFFETLNSDGLPAAVQHLNNLDSSNGAEQIAKANLAKYFVTRFFPNSNKKSSSQDSVASDSGISKADQKRIAWLLKSINSFGVSTTALSELRIEFDKNWLLANCKIFNSCLSRIKDFGAISQLYLLRWEAIGHHRPRTVVEDLKNLQPRSLEFGGYGGAWMNLLVESMNYTVWQRDPQSVAHNDECWKEISENDQTWMADSVELLMLAADDWMKMHDGAKWSAAIPWARNTLPETSREMWMPIAKDISSDPRGSLKLLDSRFQASSLAMTVFEEGLQNLASISGASEEFGNLGWDDTRKLVACYFTEFGQTDYASNRVPMMEFCILNQISPGTFAAAANSFLSGEHVVSWYELVQKDGPLKCVVNACHATNC